MNQQPNSTRLVRSRTHSLAASLVVASSSLLGPRHHQRHRHHDKRASGECTPLGTRDHGVTHRGARDHVLARGLVLLRASRRALGPLSSTSTHARTHARNTRTNLTSVVPRFRTATGDRTSLGGRDRGAGGAGWFDLLSEPVALAGLHRLVRVGVLEEILPIHGHSGTRQHTRTPAFDVARQ